ncbi:AMP-binding protein, partial [Streptomyces sp. JV184]|uniref:AMP-binding protein n=1 Tax=Streptomyces sp. JV184 TaxID=858637 RepID=UPI002E787226
AQVVRSPDAVAVVHEGESLSYAELNARANRLAHLLVAEGVGPEDLVAICLPRSVDLVVSLLAVVKAGAAYLPLDPDYPVERLVATVADSGPVVVVTAGGVGLGADVGVRRVVLDDPAVSGVLSGMSVVDPVRVGHCPEHPAYVIYTSGSTGRPKGVVVAHEGVVNRLAWMQEDYGLG